MSRRDEIMREIRSRSEEIGRLVDELGDLPPDVVTGAPAPDVATAAPTSVEGQFSDYGAFYDFLRSNSMLGPKISSDELEGCDRIIGAFLAAGAPVSYCAYGLATAYLETAHTMQPIDEMGGSAYFKRMYDIQGSRPAKARELGNLSPGDGAKFHGRGFVQLTGKTNYAKATAKLRALGFNADLVADPDRAKEPEIAATIMVYGMIEGWFTGRKLGDDLPRKGPATLAQFTASRDIINGRDRQAEIAEFANDFQTGLQEAGYGLRPTG